MEGERRPHMLPVIVVAQLMGGSLWFVGNSVVGEVAPLWPQVTGAVGWLTSAVQLGFLAGTLVYAVLGLSDRFAAHRVFLVSCLLGAIANAAVLLAPERFAWFLGARVLTGFCLAGIYPVGMKLAASWYRAGVGWAIGLLVGALVLGTALPHLLRTASLPWRPVILATSGLAVVGGLLVGTLVPEGPYVKRAGRFEVRRALAIFGRPHFRRAALGYFGHMWELYALWAFVPLAVAHVLRVEQGGTVVAWWSFAIIGVGSLGCAVGGWVAGRRGSAAVATVQLCASGLACLVSPWMLEASPAVALPFMLAWGVVVVGDSPQFSALGARTAPADLVGTGLTLMTAVGFGLTIGSISLLGALAEGGEVRWLFVWLLPGPIAGVLAMLPLWRCDPTRG
ncbi:MFS transporter [Paraliomyxa miuraensis]|uniref:MFS transporter n=1 Tax=Paraliomyxa miuraensis TaxID=376150 RepID=UPI00225C20FA|nr:MFS transporter [Paraliomyxa miuraensis]MCX4242733.1 MFS transporter [Paraliomyxa miuraensis]